jgi:uncharacterized protein (TIRG00374 family)
LTEKSKKLFFRSFVSLALIVIIFVRIDFRSLAQLFLSVNPLLFLLAGLLLVAQQALTAFSWGILLRTKQNNLPFKKVLEAHIVGNFLGTFMPSSLGYDVARVFRLSKHLTRRVDAISSMFVCRAIGLLVLLLFAFGVSLPISQLDHDAKTLWLVMGMLGVFLLALGLLLNKRFIRTMGKLFDRIGLDGVKEKLRQVYLSILEYSSERVAVLQVGLMTLVLQVIGILFIYFVGLSLGVSVPLVYFFIFIPIIAVITLLPISVAGIGLREGSFIYFFSHVGATEPQALSMSLLVFAQTLLLALIGGIFYWVDDDPIKRKVVAQAFPADQQP